MSKLAKWRGLVALVGDAVEHGSRAVERVQLETAKRPFTILKHIPPIALPAEIVHVAHDASVKVTYGAIRGISAVVVKTAGMVLEEIDKPADDGSGG